MKGGIILLWGFVTRAVRDRILCVLKLRERGCRKVSHLDPSESSENPIMSNLIILTIQTTSEISLVVVVVFGFST